MVQGDWDALLAFADKFLLDKQVERRFDEFPEERTSATTDGAKGPDFQSLSVLVGEMLAGAFFRYSKSKAALADALKRFVQPPGTNELSAAFE